MTTCDGSGSGSGFLVGPQTVVTAAHVVDGVTSISLRFGDEVFSGDPVLVDVDEDLALVRVRGRIQTRYLELAGGEARVGEEVAVIGYPEGRPIAMTQGAVTSTDLRVNVDGEDRFDYFRTDAAINPGNSGGPVIDRFGRVVGVVSAGGSAEGAGYAVSLPAIAAVVGADPGPAATPIEPDVCPTYGDADPWTTPVSITVSSTWPDAPSVAQTLQLYANAINDRYFALVWELLTPRMQQRAGSLERYAEGLSTSSWISIDVLEVTTVDDVTDEVSVLARTEQAAQYGPAGATCSDWRITYTLVLDAGYWQIDGAALTAGQEPTVCSG